MLEVYRVSKSFGAKLAVDNVTFKVRKGEVATLIGPNASGKTTILKLVAGLLEPDSGTIVIGGDIVYDKPPGDRRPRVNRAPYERNLGYLPQEPSLFPHLTVRENIELPLRKRGWSKADIAKRVREVLELTGLEGYENMYPRELSAGLRQKASIARILAYNPPLILLDEPFSQIDPASREKLRVELLDLFRRLGYTVLLTTHLLEDILFFRDHILAVVDGRLVYDGSLSEEEVVSSKYMVELLGFLSIPVKVIKCVENGKAIVGMGGGEVTIEYNPHTSICREGSELHIVVNPGLLNIARGREASTPNSVLLKAYIRDYVDEVTRVRLIAEIEGRIAKITIAKTEWMEVRESVGKEVFLRVAGEHVHLVELK